MCLMPRVLHNIHNQLTDSAEAISLTRRPRLTPKEDSWYSVLLDVESTPGL
jgi:hypothetical protein